MPVVNIRRKKTMRLAMPPPAVKQEEPSPAVPGTATVAVEPEVDRLSTLDFDGTQLDWEWQDDPAQGPVVVEEAPAPTVDGLSKAPGSAAVMKAHKAMSACSLEK